MASRPSSRSARRAALWSGLALVASASVASRSVSSRAAPTPGAPFFARETSLAYLSAADVVVLAYDDQSGAVDVGADGTTTPKAQPTWAGASLSRDRGRTWTRVGPIAPAKADCGDPACPVSLLGAPRVVVDDTGSRAYYAVRASTGAARDPSFADAIAITTSADGATWTTPRVSIAAPDEGVAEPFSMDTAVRGLAVAYVGAKTGAVYVTSADYVGVIGGTNPVFIPTVRLALPMGEAKEIRNPILRLSDNYHGWIAYMRPHDAMGSTFDLVVAQVTRFKSVDVPFPPYHINSVVDWYVEKLVFERDDIEIDPLVPGGLERPWRDAMPVAFEVGGYTGSTLFLAYRVVGPDSAGSSVLLYACNTNEAYCQTKVDAGKDWDGWSRHVLDDCSVHGGQYQPSIVLGPGAREVGVAFYQRLTDDPGDLRVTLQGARSSDGGLSFSTVHPLEGGKSWLPCPDARGPRFSPHGYGDYFGGVAVPAGTSASFVTAHPTSDACEDHGEATFDQHVETITW